MSNSPIVLFSWPEHLVTLNLPREEQCPVVAMQRKRSLATDRGCFPDLGRCMMRTWGTGEGRKESSLRDLVSVQAGYHPSAGVQGWGGGDWIRKMIQVRSQPRSIRNCLNEFQFHLYHSGALPDAVSVTRGSVRCQAARIKERTHPMG